MGIVRGKNAWLINVTGIVFFYNMWRFIINPGEEETKALMYEALLEKANEL